MSTLRTNLIKLRQDKGLSQKNVAIGLGISRSLLAMIESGEREPTPEILKKFADYYKVKPSDLHFEGMINTEIAQMLKDIRALSHGDQLLVRDLVNRLKRN